MDLADEHSPEPIEPSNRGTNPRAAPRRVAPRPLNAPPFIAGRSAAIRAMLDWVHRVARTRLPVLVHGETGSGKELVARAIHQASPRCGAPLVSLNCTALADTLVDAELFGARRGAFTGADSERRGLIRTAHGGTLFLDEIGEMPAAMQAKLLRVIQEGRIRPVGDDEESAVDVRFVSATHRDLGHEVASGRFRADLFHRLSVLEIAVPPLRERLEDLPCLVEALSPRLACEVGERRVRLAPCAWRALSAYHWPGNVRELGAALARALLRAGSSEIRSAHLDLGARERESHRAPEAETLERSMVEAALRGASGSVTVAAERIGWTRQKLYRRMRALAIASRGPQSSPPRGGRITSSDSSTFQ